MGDRSKKSLDEKSLNSLAFDNAVSCLQLSIHSIQFERI